MLRLRASIEYALQAHGVRGGAVVLGNSVVVRGPEPLGVAALLQHMPGVAWIAAGFGAGSERDLGRVGETLARLYLRPGDRFSVQSEGTGGASASDVGGALTSRILGAVKGARVSESPKVRFRVAADGPRGVVGVQVRAGAGGVPTGTERALCLVSGGPHSSVTAWMAVLAGFRVGLVHAKANDQGLLAVARLYSELSNRADPRGLGLEVLEGGSAARMLSRYVSGSKVRIFGGFAALGPSAGLRRAVASPLYLMPEERFEVEFESLGIKAFDGSTRWDEGGASEFSTRRFRGGPADVSDVLDGLH